MSSPHPRPAADGSARLLLVLSAATFGGTWVAAPWATSEIPPLAVAALRFGIAAVLLFAWCRWRRLPIALRAVDLPIVLAVAATSVVGYNVLFLYGVTLAPASHGAVIVPGLIPVVTLVLARIVFREPIAWVQAGGVLLGLLGLFLVIGPAFAGGRDEVFGDAMYVGGAVVWATYSILSRGATRRFEPAVITFLSAAVGAVVLLALSLVLEPGGFATAASASARGLAGVLYLATFGTVVSFVLFAMGVQRIGSARASAYAVLIPLFGVAATVTILGESIEPVAAVGAALVIGGLALTQVRDRRPARVRTAAASSDG